MSAKFTHTITAGGSTYWFSDWGGGRGILTFMDGRLPENFRITGYMGKSKANPKRKKLIVANFILLPRKLHNDPAVTKSHTWFKEDFSFIPIILMALHSIWLNTKTYKQIPIWILLFINRVELSLKSLATLFTASGELPDACYLSVGLSMHCRTCLVWRISGRENTFAAHESALN